MYNTMVSTPRPVDSAIGEGIALKSPKESEPLLDRPKWETIQEGYSTKKHVVLEDETEIVIDYKVWQLSTFKVLFAFSGSILKEPVLWIEQLLITLVFLAASMPSYWFFSKRLAFDHKGDQMSVRKWLDGQEPNMRSFAMIMTGLCVFLLSFYTSLGVARWWRIRTEGVGGLKSASTELVMLIYHLVTKEEQVIDSIRRYTLSSLLLCFLWRGNHLPQMKNVLGERKLLTEEEIQLLDNVNHNLHETIWAWQIGIVNLLYKRGKIESDQLLNLLLDRCREGRGCMQLIHTHLNVKIPLQYVHMLSFLVKLHNAVLAVIMGLLFGAAVKSGEVIICVQLFGRTLLLPFLFNALLCINAELSDPFDGGYAAFPRDSYIKALDRDFTAFIQASKNLPGWIQQPENPEV